MTYPPPPPGQPGAGGWPAGDPHESPTTIDPNPQNQPPGYQGYPPPGYGPPGYAPPGYYQQPGMPPQPPRRSYLGWIIGGVAGGVVLFMLLGLGVVLVLRANNADDPGTGSQDPGLALPTGDPATPPAGGDDPVPPPAPAGDGTYGFVPDLCETLDLSPVFDIVATPESPDEWYTFESDSSFSSHSSCTISLEDGRSLGSLSIQVDTSQDPESARDLYEIMADASITTPDTVEDLNAPWEQGELWLGDDLADEAARLIAYDGNLAVSVHAWLFSAPGSQDQLADAVVQVAEEILTLHAQ